MKTLFHLIISIICISSFIACECRGVDCAGDHQEVLLRFMRDGENAVFGPDAFIREDSVRYIDEYSLLIDRQILFMDSGILYNYLSESAPLIIRLDSIRTDTFSITTEVTDTEGCCVGYTATSVLRNGQVVCTGACEGVIDVEI